MNSPQQPLTTANRTTMRQLPPRLSNSHHHNQRQNKHHDLCSVSPTGPFPMSLPLHTASKRLDAPCYAITNPPEIIVLVTFLFIIDLYWLFIFWSDWRFFFVTVKVRLCWYGYGKVISHKKKEAKEEKVQVVEPLCHSLFTFSICYFSFFL